MLTIQIDGIRISQLLGCNINLLVGDRREEGNHVVVPVVTNGSHLIWEGGVGWSKPSHPLVKNGVSESVEHLQDKQPGEKNTTVISMTTTPPCRFSSSHEI